MWQFFDDNYVIENNFVKAVPFLTLALVQHRQSFWHIDFYCCLPWSSFDETQPMKIECLSATSGETWPGKKTMNKSAISWLHYNICLVSTKVNEVHSLIRFKYFFLNKWFTGTNFWNKNICVNEKINESNKSILNVISQLITISLNL